MERNLGFEKIDSELRQDYLGLNKNVAISSEGVAFKIGDEVCHDGSDINGEKSIITSFTVDENSMDIVAHTEKGYGRISFLYHPQ